jgi:hypothetical protein
MSVRTSASSSTNRMVSEEVVGDSDTARSHLKGPTATRAALETVKASCLKGDFAINPFRTPVKVHSAVPLSN